MKYAHIADVHMGGWRHPKMCELSFAHFDKVIEICIEKNIEFLLISGDLFNTSFPGIDALRAVTKNLKALADNGIRVYAIAGSHDFSPSGKTMIDVLENAGLLVNVAKGDVVEGKLNLKFTLDRSGAKITGIPGRANMLDKRYYEELELEPLEAEQGYKIFMFHTAITELKPKGMEKMESQPISLLPKNFSYYAGGHVHMISDIEIPGYRNIIYPGPVFPNSFSELEHLKEGSMFIVEDNVPKRISINLKKVVVIKLSFEMLDPASAKSKIFQEINRFEVKDCVVLLRISGSLKNGRVSDIGFYEIIEWLYSKGAFFVMKNSMISTQEYQNVKVSLGSAEEIEERLISENPKKHLVISLMFNLNSFKHEGETSSDFENRIVSGALEAISK